VASYFPHHGEEDCLRGWKGSGTIFFSLCNLRCVFCQNYDISQYPQGEEVPPARLADMMLELQQRGCHNINFVTPEHVVPQILEAMPLAAERGLRLPLIYNTSAYDSLDSLHLLDGIVDIYMPDFKFWDPAVAKDLTQAEDYPEIARQALKEMHRQVGDLVMDEKGVARRGLLVRHLVLPDGLAGTQEVMEFLAREISPNTYVNVMGQYRPCGRAGEHPSLRNFLTALEHEQAQQMAREAGLSRLDRREKLFRWL
jgi:putative pyruvate formate lyase activating enzyme